MSHRVRSGALPSPGVISGAVALVVLLLAGGMFTGLPGTARAEPAPAAAPEFVNISATSSLNFVPDSFTVLPGSLVHLVVTQMADFDHTFTLSPAVNVTVSPSFSSSQLRAFFNAHPPIVNLSLGSTAGLRFFVNFTAPSVLGTYEYLCLIHFPSMAGVMTVASSLPSGGGSSGPSTLEIIEIGVVVGLIVIVVGLVAWSRARRRVRSRGGSPPAT